MAIEATDWRMVSDASGVYNFLDGPTGGGTRGAPGLDPRNGNNADTAQAQPLTNGDAVVDGNCATTGGEYTGAGSFSNGNMSGFTGTSGSYVFVCVSVTADTTNDVLDAGTIYFDTQHNGGGTPQTDDRKFSVLLGGTLVSYKGDNTAWIPCTSPACDSGNVAAGAFTGGHPVYEFKIRFNNTWGTDTPAPNQVAGFAVLALDITGATTYTWGSASPPTDTVPDTWGHINAPEFTDILVPIAVVGVIYLLARRRRRDADS